MNFSLDCQCVIVNNVVNVNMLGFMVQDLDCVEFECLVSEVMSQCCSVNGMCLCMMCDNYIEGSLLVGGVVWIWLIQDIFDSEIMINGNFVVLEEQMVKVNEMCMCYEIVLSFYQKSLGLICIVIWLLLQVRKG